MSPSFLELAFPKTGLPLNTILGNSAGIRRAEEGSYRKPIFWHHGFLETSVAPIAAQIRKRLAFHRHKLPIIATRVEGELQDAVGVIVVDLSVPNRTLYLIVALAPAGTDHELTDAF